MKIIKQYCPCCGKETNHEIYKEDSYGARGIGRIFSTIISLGISQMYIDTVCKCLECRHKN